MYLCGTSIVHALTQIHSDSELLPNLFEVRLQGFLDIQEFLPMVCTSPLLMFVRRIPKAYYELISVYVDGVLASCRHCVKSVSSDLTPYTDIVRRTSTHLLLA